MKETDKKIVLALLAPFFIFISLPSLLFAASMSDYCVVPPYVSPSVHPNLLLMFDNSASQYDPAYIGGATSCTSNSNCPAGQTCVNGNCAYNSCNGLTCTTDSQCDPYKCVNGSCAVTESFCLDDTYNNSTNYYGYFQKLDANNNLVSVAYQYQSPGTNHSSPGASDKFTEYSGSVPTSGCDIGNGTGYFCINYSGSPAIVTSFIASGNFLNWLSTSKFDVQKKALTGGKYDTTNQVVVGESRGCVGRRFIKMVKQPNSTSYWDVTFAVRGPGATDPDYVNPVTQGGTTRVEIFLALNSNIAACQCAIANWTLPTGNRGQAGTQTNACLNIGNTKISSFNQIMQDCWQIKDNIDGCGSNPTVSCLFSNVSINSDKVKCESVYNDVKSLNNDTYSTCAQYLAPGNEGGGAWQCTACAEHGLPTGAYAAGGTDTTGFLGKCVDFGGGCSNSSHTVCTSNADCTISGETCLSTGQCGFACTNARRDCLVSRFVSSSTNTSCSSSADDCNTRFGHNAFCAQGNKCAYLCTTGGTISWLSDACVQREILHYCSGLQTAEVIDPSTGTADSLQTGNIPSVLQDSSVSQFGTPAGTMFARISVSTAPTGVINEFKNIINFGAMTFNQDGSASECGQTGTNFTCMKNCSRNTINQCLLSTDCNWCSGSTSCASNTDCSSGYLCGAGKCTKHCCVTSGTACTSDANCFVPETCVSGACTCPSSYICSGSDGSCISITDGGAAETCGASALTNGGKIISYINYDPVGDHTTVPSLINTIDNLKAVSWTPFAEAFYNAIGYFAKMSNGNSRDDMHLNTSLGTTQTAYALYSYREDQNPNRDNSQSCQDNDILIITDGMSTADWTSTTANSTSSPVYSLVDKYNSLYPSVYQSKYGYDTTNLCPKFSGSRSLPGLSWVAQNRKISDTNLLSGTAADCSISGGSCYNRDHINTLVVFAGAGATCASNADCTVSGEKCISGRCDKECTSDTNCTSPETCILGRCSTGFCDSYTLMNAAAIYGGTKGAIQTNYASLEADIRKALENVIKRAAAGTAASVLASGEGSGANLIQAVFYPKRRFKNSTTGVYDDISWTGRLSNFWYYADPLFGSSSIYEDNGSSSKGVLDRGDDNKITLYYDATAEATKAQRTSPSGSVSNIEFEKLNTLWEAGYLLWKRSSSNRTIFTPCRTEMSGTCDSTGLMDFSTANKGTYTTTDTLAYDLQAGSATEADNIINYTRGTDISGYRTRTIGIKICSGTTTICETDSDCGGVSGSCASAGTYVWKLGDILDSTPKIASWIQLNNYDSVYKDGSYATFRCSLCQPDCPTGVSCSSGYNSRGLVFAGANDGMLHAFKLGTLRLKWSGQSSSQYAQLTNPDAGGAACDAASSSQSGKECGREEWAFIPQNALPYLKYIADPGYCHIYTEDLPPYVFDASIGGIATDNRPADGTTWRTILIGGMKFGGGCKDTNYPGTNGVKIPQSGIGYSSYFALDITDTVAHPHDPATFPPKLLWEFSRPTDRDLGFSSSGPVVVRVGDKDKNGKWFVIFASGPTGPIDADKQFLGLSDQALKVFVLELNGDGTPVATFSALPDGTTIGNAFAGSIANTSWDPDLNYQDNAVYIPYVSGTSGTDGGILRLQTLEDTTPDNWKLSKVIDGIGPISSGLTMLQNNKWNILWLYAGEGRFFYKKPGAVDDANTQRKFFGIKEPCYDKIKNKQACSSSDTVSVGDLTDVTCSGGLEDCVPDEGDANDASFKGWSITLDDDGSYTYDSITQDYYAERVITIPSSTTSGVVFFTSYKPYQAVCGLGGKSFLWAVRYNTGGSVADTLKGNALIQLSTGAIEQVNLSQEFGPKKNPDEVYKGRRRTDAMEGQPPQQTPPILTTQPPTKRTLHIRER